MNVIDTMDICSGFLFAKKKNFMKIFQPTLT